MSAAAAAAPALAKLPLAAVPEAAPLLQPEAFVPNAAFDVGDVLQVGGETFACTRAGTGASAFTAEQLAAAGKVALDYFMQQNTELLDAAEWQE